MKKKEKYIEQLRLSDTIREPVIRAAVSACEFPKGSRGLDVGCGIGSHTMQLAETVGADGEVVGLDHAPEFLEHARQRLERSSCEASVSFHQGSVSQLPFPDDSFDWAWSVDCIGMIPGDTSSYLRELARVLRPGSITAISIWSSQQLLPGYPVLESHLNATSTGIAPFSRSLPPEQHPLRLLGRMEKAGFRGLLVSTFAGTVQAPLPPEVRQALLSLIEMRWGNPESELSAADWAEYQRLCAPTSPDLIVDIPDYYAFFTYSMFRGLSA